MYPLQGVPRVEFSPEEVRLVSLFLEYKQHTENRSVNTIKLYERGLRLLKQSVGAEIGMPDVTLVQLHAFTGKFLHEIEMKPRARLPFVAGVREFYRYLHKTGVLNENRAEELPYPRIGRPLPEAMEYQWAEKLLMAPDLNSYQGTRDLMMLMLLGMGLRVSGVCGLNESDLRFAVQKNGTETLTVHVNEKGRVDRMVPMPPEVWVTMRSYLAHPYLSEVDRNIRGGADKVLFVNLRNRSVKKEELYGERLRIQPNGVYTRMRIYARRIGMPAKFAHPHAMRHMFGMALADAGYDTLDIMVLMGHRQAETAALYHHLAEVRRREIVMKSNPFRKFETVAGQLLDQAGRGA